MQNVSDLINDANIEIKKPVLEKTKKLETVYLKKYIVELQLAVIDEDGEEINWSDNNYDYEYFDTRLQAEIAAEEYKQGRHWYYGDLVVSAEVQDEPQIVEYFNDVEKDDVLIL